MNRRMFAALAASLLIAIATRAQDATPAGGAGTPGGTQPPRGNAGGAPTTQAPGKGTQGKGGTGSPFGGGTFGSGLGLQQPGMPGMGGTGFSGPGMGGMGFGSGMMGGAAKKEKDIKTMTLDELLAKAVKDNPDIRVAEAKVRETEAELNRTRLQVLQKVAKLHEEVIVSRQILEEAQRRLETNLRMNSSLKEIADARLTVARAKADFVAAESQLPYLVGKQPAATPTMPSMSGLGDSMQMPMGGGSMGMMSMPGGMAPKQVPGTLVEKVRAALDTPIKGDFRDSPPREIIEWLSTNLKGINVHMSAKLAPNGKVNLKLTESIPVGAALQWLEDEFDLRCVLREYGIVIAERDHVPPGATPLLEIWKQRPKETKEKATN